MLGRVSKQAKQARSTKTKVVVDLQTPAATKIQCMMRRFVARARIRRQARKVWQRVYDPTYKKYFWFNNMDELSRWDLPQFAQLFHLEDHTACTKIEKVVRGFVARMRVRKKVNEKYTRFYDSDLNKFYWLDKSTGETTWTVTNWLRKQEIEMPPEDRMLYQSQQRILELEAMLKDKDREIRDVRKKRFEELEPEMMRDKVKSAKSLSRSKNMDEWKIEDLAAWFTELKLDEYVPFLFQNKVDGLLFLNLAEEEWPDMGITNRFHARKLQIITKAYRMRYQRKRDKVEDEEDELLSEVSPSELSAMIHAEDAADDDYSDSEEDEEDSYESEDEMNLGLTPEQVQQRALDAKNVQIILKVRGDAINFPMIGDIVRVRYVISLTEGGKIVMSTKNVLARPWIEFVLGVDQVIKGFDRALPLMSVGERSTIVVTPEYGYGKAGYPPHIPPNVSLSFDLTLLGFRARTPWVKPLIQDSSTHEKPYLADLRVYLDMVAKGAKVDSPKKSDHSPLKPMGGSSSLLEIANSPSTRGSFKN